MNNKSKNNTLLYLRKGAHIQIEGEDKDVYYSVMEVGDGYVKYLPTDGDPSVQPYSTVSIDKIDDVKIYK